VSVLKGEEDFDFPGTQHLLSEIAHRADLLHLHNLHGAYFDLRALPALSARVPTVITLHDEWMLTGHCAGSVDCARWQAGCGSCPDLKRSPSIRRDATSFNWHRKRMIYAQSRLHVVTPSRALMAKVAESILATAAASTWVIPHGIDLSVFHPADRNAARHALGLPKAAKILLFSAQGTLDNPYKDFRTLRKALAIIAQAAAAQDLILIALGKEGPAEQIGEVQLRFVPYQEDSRTVARYCQAADIYVHASKAESWGLAVTEAMACGLPVVASAVGGIPDQVEEGVTGFLVRPADADQMADRVKILLSDQDRRLAFARAAGEVARTKFGLSRMVDDYLKVYGHVLQQAVVPCPR
jgi:glycosyltransferase involved in cell wall biosynthesis